MILVVGGICQGKETFAKTLAAKGGEGKEIRIVNHVEEILREMLINGNDWELGVSRLAAEHQDSILILREMGCGIVPMEKEERLFRDAVGRWGQFLAGEAHMVYRVICGIGTRIK